MRVSELYRARVLDSDGVVMGRVDDVRFEVVAARPGDTFAAIGPDAELWPFGTVRDRFGGAVCYKLSGFACSSGVGLGHRLGYGTNPPGPWLVGAAVRPLRRRSVIVDWSDVERLDRAGVHLRRTAAELGMKA